MYILLQKIYYKNMSCENKYAKKIIRAYSCKHIRYFRIKRDASESLVVIILCDKTKSNQPISGYMYLVFPREYSNPFIL